MAVFSSPFTTPGNYTYDSDEIEVSGGLAKLKELGLWTDLYAYWKMDEALWSGVTNEVVDSGPNGFHATAINGPNTVSGGKIGRASSFDGINDYLISSSNANIIANPSFTISVWAKIPTGAVKAGSYPTFLWWGFTASGQSVYFGLFNSSLDKVYVGFHSGGQSSPTFSLDVWHHFVWVREGGNTSHFGNTLYIDGTPVGLTNELNSIIPAVSDSPFYMQNKGNSSYVESFTDELAIWKNRELTSGDVTELYNSNSGKELSKYSMSVPAIYKTAGDSDIVQSWSSFAVTEGTVEGSTRFQLSSDGITWYYWDGGTWSIAGASDYNTENTVNTNIGSFPTGPDKIYKKTFFISDGTQRVEVDEVQIVYLSNQVPLINAGANKAGKDNQSLKPFQDCIFSDPDGTVDFVRYKVDGEVDIWTEILQGAYATLLEAVQDFDYSFNNTGVLTVRLQVEDDIGAKVEDSLIMTITQYTRTISIRHPVTNEHILAIEFDPGDGSGFATRNSPFEYSWDYGSFNLTMQAEGFYSNVVNVSVSDEADLDLVMVPVSYLDECKASVGWIVGTDTLVVLTWLLRYGGTVTVPTSCTISLKNKDGTVIYTDTSSSPESDSSFKFERSPSNLLEEDVYVLDCTIVSGGVSYSTMIPLGLIDKRTSESITDIRDEALGKWSMNPDNKTLTLYRFGKYLNSFAKTRDFERSFYKFVKENYADSHGFPVYYGDLAADVNADDIWLYCNFTELNVETGHFSQAYIDVVTRINSVDDYNTQLSSVADDLREVFSNSNIDLYDFTYPEYPQRILDSKIVIMNEGRQIYERISELEYEGVKSLIQASQLTVQMKLLKNFARSKTV
jgi:hypothetical protein